MSTPSNGTIATAAFSESAGIARVPNLSPDTDAGRFMLAFEIYSKLARDYQSDHQMLARLSIRAADEFIAVWEREGRRR